MTSLRIKGYRVLVEADKVEEMSDGGIVLTSNTTQKKLEQHGKYVGTVLQIGDMAWTDKLVDGKSCKPWCNVGDRVVYARYAGKFVYDPITEEEYCVVNDEDIICVIEEEEK